MCTNNFENGVPNCIARSPNVRMVPTTGASSEQNGCPLVKTLKQSTLTLVQSNSTEQSMSVHYSEAAVSQTIQDDCTVASQKMAQYQIFAHPHILP